MLRITLEELVSRIAVIGSGISGLAAAYYLSRKHEVFLFERDERIGGHTHTVTVDSSRGPLPVDTGFIVHNDRTYPNLIRLLGELGVPRVNSDMSFAVSCRRTGYEYSSRGLAGYFAQRRNFLKPSAYALFGEIRRFNSTAPRLLDRSDANRLKLGDFLDENCFTQFFREFYLFPMASAIWSCAQNAVKEFPAVMLTRFFHNHGMLTINDHPQWKTIPGGCSGYIGPISAPYKQRIFSGANIRHVSRNEHGVTLCFANGRPSMEFDHAVFATNCDRALPLLENPTDDEREVLGKFSTSRNDVVLHCDESLLPKQPAARASWNYLLHIDSRNGHGPATMTYHMNRLQSLPVEENYCVTLNANDSIRPEKVLRKFVYHHPIFTLDSIRAQQGWKRISGVNRTHYCGAYWFYGFHEDGVNSALRVANALGVSV
ncbi:MAG TPA: FAD-dependent oxidoreductase [Candidatus Acidoferrum sp.]|nr:FAD-dependent oxidoreductase [Candidatus Acidoferrum sp.]